MPTVIDQKIINKFLSALAKDYFILAPLNTGEEIKVKEAKNIIDIDWSGQTPENSWKEAFLPPTERLFDIKNRQLRETEHEYPPLALVGMNALDLKALTLFDEVFSQDVYYQKRRRNLLIIGYASEWPIDYKKYKVFSHNFEEDILEHLIFDIFLVRLKNKWFKIYSGSKKGQLVLEKYGIKNYQHVEFAGPVPEEGPDKKMLANWEKVEKSYRNALWDDLGKLCLACGKCSIACPTCFCFDLEDKADPDNNLRQRKWGACFYNDFSRVAGGFKPLDSVKQKIFFWYTHKFVRIPKEYKIPGCVSCGRCVKVCPVGINIFKNIKELNK